MATGVPVIRLQVSGTDGRCYFQDPGNAVGMMGGCAAEWRIIYPGQIPSARTLLTHFGTEDIGNAVGFLGAPDGPLLVATWVAARRLVDEEWPSVMRIARALQQRGCLTGQEVRALWRV